MTDERDHYVTASPAVVDCCAARVKLTQGVGQAEQLAVLVCVKSGWRLGGKGGNGDGWGWVGISGDGR